MRSTRVSRHINASRANVYGVLLDPTAIAKWKVPDGMTAQIHAFEPREGGSIRVSLTYVADTATGKTATDTTGWRMALAKLATLAESTSESNGRIT